ncbi:hypothetical protein ACHQM5_001405 [Ranunculus cassubicifolius]
MLGFGGKWRRWIRACWSTAKFSILVNGEACGHFNSTRGLRQGDPMSPMIFVLAAEVLTRMVVNAQSEGLLCGFKVSPTSEPISILQYADDTLVFVDAKKEMVENLRAIMEWFELLSGLKVNYEKSSCFLVNEVADVEALKKVWCCDHRRLPGIYLGLPLGAKFKDGRVWENMVEKFRKRLAMWKRVYLSKGGRLVLVKSTLLSLPVYMLSLFVLPSSVAKELEKIVRCFLWGKKGGRRKIHLLSWNKICLPLGWGGLGVRRLKDVNVSLLSKWLWWFGEGDGKLWRRIIVGKYGCSPGGWFSKNVFQSHGVGLWKGIMGCRSWFEKYIRFEVGNGERISFWGDVWLGDLALSLF